MLTKVAFLPGKKAPRSRPATYGDKLVCARSLYDIEGHPRLHHSQEQELRARIKRAGECVNPDRISWALPLAAVRQLGLTNRIVK